MESYSIEELAELADISPSYFRNLFKRVTGLTVTQYKNRIKISKARDLILSGKCNVTEAAKTVGFNNIYYFSRLFKKITCANPSDFIKR
jgi:AraC-like DNA-binding protein